MFEWSRDEAQGQGSSVIEDPCFISSIGVEGRREGKEGGRRIDLVYV